MISLNKKIYTIYIRIKAISKARLTFALIFLCLSFTSDANSLFLKEDPSSWRLENTLPEGVTVWFTSSSCVNGQLGFPSNTSSDDKNRFWSVVLAAKMSSKKVFVFYDSESTPGYCKIFSFGIDPE